jgi:hypothetical protein
VADNRRNNELTTPGVLGWNGNVSQAAGSPQGGICTGKKRRRGGVVGTALGRNKGLGQVLAIQSTHITLRCVTHTGPSVHNGLVCQHLSQDLGSLPFAGHGT